MTKRVRGVPPVFRRGTGVLAAVALSLCAAVHAGDSQSIAAFAEQVDSSYPTLSPDGNLVAWVTRMDKARVLMVLDLAKHQRRAVIAAVQHSFEITSCTFKNNERLLCAYRGVEMYRGSSFPVTRLVAVDATGTRKPKVLLQNGDSGGAQFQDRIIDWLPDDPGHVLIQLSGDGDPFPGVYKLDIYAGTTDQVERPRTPILRWLTDHDGVVRFGYGFERDKHTYIARESQGAPWRTLATWVIGHEAFTVIGFGTSPGTLLVEAPYEGHSAIFEMDLHERKERKLLFSHPQVDVGQPIYWPADRSLIGFEYHTERPHRVLFDEKARITYGALDALRPGEYITVSAASRDNTKLLVVTQSDVHPDQFYVLDINEKKLILVGSANAALEDVALAPMKSVSIRATDGQMLSGYLTLPSGSNGRNLPTVVFAHAGPHERNGWGFDPMVQFMASRGYAVVQVNFRGSTGYGKQWHEAGLRNWGTVMVDDINAATKWAIAEGIAQPGHVCIAGWDFGGYAALMSAIREPGLYRCAVSIGGISDLRAFAVEKSRFYGGTEWSEYTIGENNSGLVTGSPLHMPEKVDVPVLFVHGERDVVVDADHSRRMARALARENKKFELVIVPDGNHSLSRYEWRETLLTKLEAFLGANLSGAYSQELRPTMENAGQRPAFVQ
jgi:dipeptidyl aminopeptidase/acylaminoacyl peptidase